MEESAIDISLLLPTRGRPQLLQRLFGSLCLTTAAPGRLEVVLYVDEDDAPTRGVTHPALSLVTLIKPANEKMGRMNQLCYEASRGRYVMLMNDDVVFRTQAWDRRILESFTKFPDDIALVYGNDLYQGKALPTLPVLSRRFCELMGGVCPGSYQNTYIDLHLFDLFKKLGKLGYPRLAYHDDLVFEHLHHETGKVSLDKTYVKKNEQEDDRLFISLDDERWSQAKMLKRHIEATPGGGGSTGVKREMFSRFKNLFSCDKSKL